MKEFQLYSIFLNHYYSNLFSVVKFREVLFFYYLFITKLFIPKVMQKSVKTNCEFIYKTNKNVEMKVKKI